MLHSSEASQNAVPRIHKRKPSDDADIPSPYWRNLLSSLSMQSGLHEELSWLVPSARRVGCHEGLRSASSGPACRKQCSALIASGSVRPPAVGPGRRHLAPPASWGLGSHREPPGIWNFQLQLALPGCYLHNVEVLCDWESGSSSN